jgi:hypothetical protein
MGYPEYWRLRVAGLMSEIEKSSMVGKRVKSVIADHQMVKEGDAEDLSGIGETFGE